MEIAISRQQNSALLALLMEMRAVPLARDLICHHGFVFSKYTAPLKQLVFYMFSTQVFWVVRIVYT